VREKMQVFMDRLEAHYGQRPIIYTAPDFYADNLKGAFLDYPFWLRSVAAHPSGVIQAANGCSGSIPVQACRTAFAAGST
jgi:GH25 family lysozyme M1 (1,4-beta-N-acetylmuramidase)